MNKQACETIKRTPSQQAAATRRDRLLEIAKITENPRARRALQQQAEQESILSGERRIYTEPWAASLRVQFLPPDFELQQALEGAHHIEIVDVLPDVTLAQGEYDVWYLTDDVHPPQQGRALLTMTRSEVTQYIRRILERYYRLVIPLRLAETSQLQGALSIIALNGAGQPYQPGNDGVIEVKSPAPLMVHVTHKGDKPLHVYALNVASSGRCQVLAHQILEPGGNHRFGDKDKAGSIKPWKLVPGKGRTFAIDRFVVLGTTSLNRDLGTLLQDEPFISLFSVSRGSTDQEQDPLPELEAWAASNLTFRITSSGCRSGAGEEDDR